LGIETICHKENIYPKFQAEGNAAQFAIPFAKHFCFGDGVDVGCAKQEWAFPGAMLIDPKIDSRYHAMNIPVENLDYVFSSHCLEHVNDWIGVLDYWTSKLVVGGVMFLYLPDFSQTYWRPWSNRKHKHCLTPEIVSSYFIDNELYTKVYVSGIDLNNSFVVVAEKMIACSGSKR